jgi:hypothetical protein
VVQAGTTQEEVEVEPWVLPAGVGTEVGRKPTTATDAGVDAHAAGEAGRSSRGGAPSGTSWEHFWYTIWYLAMMTLLTNSGNDPPVLSTMRSYSFMERPIMKRSFFLSSVSTSTGAYCARWLNNFE